MEARVGRSLAVRERGSHPKVSGTSEARRVPRCAWGECTLMAKHLGPAASGSSGAKASVIRGLNPASLGFVFGSTCGLWTFLVWGSNPCSCRDNTGSLTHCTREGTPL